VEFIPLAEETGLIVPIGEWVLRTACEQGARWLREGKELMVAVNLSGRQFRNDNLVEHIRGIVAETGMDPRLLELEMTESILMDNSNQAMARLEAIRALGIRLSIDDFGTGYSSMSYLKRFPISKLKIDRSFISDLPHDMEDMEITKAIIVLAKVLGLEVLAEGVETREQADCLLANGCVMIQGYYCSKPLVIEEFDGLLEAHANGYY
jgi:EAL domain-containing protein (putative c-di-GMP-specific phosphodiesterase class I)